MKLAFLDILVLGFYMLAMVSMGFYFSKKNKNTEEYFLGGRRFGGWAIGLSMMGTAISSITFLAMPADAFKTTWIRYITYGGLPIAVFIAAVYIVPIFRRLNITSAYEYLEDRFGPSIRIYGSITYLLAQLSRISIVLYLLAVLLSEITNIELSHCIVIMGLFVGLYTVIGGIDAVIWTDVFQTIVLSLGSIIGLWIIVDALPGGFMQIIDVAQAHNKFSLGDLENGVIQPSQWHLSLSEKTATMILFAGISFFLTEYVSSQHMIQRYCATKNVAEARKGLIVNVCISIPVWTFFMLFGTALYVFFVQFPSVEATEALDGTRNAEHVVPHFILNHLPAGLTGLLLAAALAAGMSSLDSSINAISTVSIVDLYKRHIKKGQSDHHYLIAAKTIASIATLIMIFAAYKLIGIETTTIQHTAFIISSILTGGILGLFVLGLLTTVGDARSVWVGIVFTMAFTWWAVFQHKLPIDFSLNYYYIGMIGNFLMFVLGFFVALLLPRRTRDLNNKTVWTMRSE